MFCASTPFVVLRLGSHAGECRKHGGAESVACAKVLGQFAGAATVAGACRNQEGRFSSQAGGLKAGIAKQQGKPIGGARATAGAVTVEPTEAALSPALPRGNQRAQQAGAGVFHQVEHGFEAGAAAVVGVGHLAGGVVGAKVGQAPQLVRVLGRAQGAGGAPMWPPCVPAEST